MKLAPLFSLILFLALSVVAVSLGGYLTSISVNDWYPTLTKPSWNPPNWVFGPVWTTLYVMMAVAAWRVWLKQPHPGVPSGILAYLIQLALNTSWSGMFFALQNPMLGFVNIFLLWVAILWTIERFWWTSRVAAILMIPYVLWVTYAMALNFTIWRLN